MQRTALEAPLLSLCSQALCLQALHKLAGADGVGERGLDSLRDVLQGHRPVQREVAVRLDHQRLLVSCRTPN